MDDRNLRDAAREAKRRDRRLALLRVALVFSGPGLIFLGLFLFIGNLRYFLWNVQCYGVPTRREVVSFFNWLLIAIACLTPLLLPLMILTI